MAIGKDKTDNLIASLFNDNEHFTVFKFGFY